MNSEGIVLEYSSEPFHKSDEIIAGINAHFGTSFYQEDDIDKDFTIGETMPNWNAYEKIGLPPIMLYKYKNPINQVWFFGEVENANAKIYGEDENTYFVLNDAGSIIGKNSANVDMLKDEIKTAIEAKISESLQSISIVSTSYQMGDAVDNWNDYEIV